MYRLELSLYMFLLNSLCPPLMAFDIKSILLHKVPHPEFLVNLYLYFRTLDGLFFDYKMGRLFAQ